MSTFRPYLDECGEIVKFDLPSIAIAQKWPHVCHGTILHPRVGVDSLFNTQWETICMFWEREDSRRTSAFRFIHHRIRDFCRNSTRPLRSAGLAQWHKLQLLIVPKDSKGKTRVKLMGDRDLHILKKVNGPGGAAACWSEGADAIRSCVGCLLWIALWNGVHIQRSLFYCYFHSRGRL